ncbi:T-cell immunoreceptor with Ig and ITIM domains [Echinops telfairi]|uniref:T-cell immunoreceptor with Ig and ITIM domains n=1 Tax=Echinops telfairi TaxID=9371 RepID=UPI001E1DDC74|nr:T-cell immunoreceptor with Ig and ITIM domains [Echinops telfairi]
MLLVFYPAGGFTRERTCHSQLSEARDEGAVEGRIVTPGNVSAVESGSVTLQCHLSHTAAEVTQVNWARPYQTLAIHHNDYGWYITPDFRKQVVPGPGLGLTLQRLTCNDTGEYACIYYTFPDGIYHGRLFLEVLGSSEAKHRAGFQMSWLGALVTVPVVICTVAIGLVTLSRKRRSLGMPAAGSSPRTMACEQEYSCLGVPLSPGRCGQAEAASANPQEEERQDDVAPNEYFNVLSYRSLGSVSFLVERA